MTTKHHAAVTEAHDDSFDVTAELTLGVAPGSTRLFNRGAQLVSIRTKPGEELVDEPKFRTATAVVSFEKMTDTPLECAAVALYGALRRARIDERPSMVAKAGILPAELTKLIRAEGLRGTDLVATRIDTAVMALARAFEPALAVEPSFYVREVADTVKQHVRRAFERGFFASVGRGKLSREQYVYVMSQQHSYVKYTTRILGYCVAYAQESHLRKHFSKHLSEEINHEKIIETDLAHLGADVDYVIDDLEPNVATLQFTLGELALVSHFHDSILLTAAPLAAEGLTAHLDRAFITALNDIIASWGVQNPEKATRFLASHIDFDSGYEGHFQGSMRLLAEFLTNERNLRRYVAALHAQMNSFLRIYEDGMSESLLWS
jgi:hypothetical protein